MIWDPLLVIGIFLLGASAGSLLARIQRTHVENEIRGEMEPELSRAFLRAEREHRYPMC